MRNLKRVANRLCLLLVGVFYAVALAGSFEQANDAAGASGGSPIWSSVFGFPVPHHYLLGFAGLAVCLVILLLGGDVKREGTKTSSA